jgi:predicted phosphodiesterase
MVKLQIVSDMHLEFRGTNFQTIIKPSAPILCMVGDICACGTVSDFQIYKKFIKYIAPKFQYIFHISGNHEYYATGNKNILYSDTVPGINKKIHKYLQEFKNVFYLNNDTFKLTFNKKNYIFIGTTLWTGVRQQDKKKVGDMMNDYCNIYTTIPPKEKKCIKLVNKIKQNNIRNFNIDDMTKLHKQSLNYIKREIKKIKSNEIGVVLTHHKPYRSDDINNIISQAYETDIVGTIIKQPHNVKLFVYGHTHIADDKYIDKVRIVSNPKGYPSQKTKYQNNFTISV